MARDPKVKEIVLELNPDPDSGDIFIVRKDAEGEPAPSEEASAEPLAEATESAASELPERLVLTADREIVLQVGKASITLTKAGKIILRGTYVVSRSSGVNKIKGGSVQIN